MKLSLESLLRDAGKVVVPRELLERAMHAMEEAEFCDHRDIATEIEAALMAFDEEAQS